MRPEKQQLAEDIRQYIEPSTFVFLFSYKGLDVDQFNDLRARLAEQNAECHVVPNRLLRIALRDTDAQILADRQLQGETAMITGGGDAVAAAKTLSSFIKEKDNEQVAVKYGALAGQELSAADVASLASLPSREVLLAQLLGVLNGPARNLVGVLSAAKSGIVYALKAHLNNKEQS
ncbi:MAG: 50S ribosomal protein L10 [Verrucomicrobiota bacterium]